MKINLSSMSVRVLILFPFFIFRCFSFDVKPSHPQERSEGGANGSVGIKKDIKMYDHYFEEEKKQYL